MAEITQVLKVMIPDTLSADIVPMSGTSRLAPEPVLLQKLKVVRIEFGEGVFLSTQRKRCRHVYFEIDERFDQVSHNVYTEAGNISSRGN